MFGGNMFNLLMKSALKTLLLLICRLSDDFPSQANRLELKLVVRISHILKYFLIACSKVTTQFKIECGGLGQSVTKLITVFSTTENYDNLV